MKLSSRTRTWLFAGLTLLVAGYLVAAWLFTTSASATRMCEGVLITVHDTADIHFVTPQELANELGDLPEKARKTRLSDIDINDIEQQLSSFDKIERVEVNILTSGQLLIDVWPMRPFARIFDSAGHSYYINRDGKKIAAESGYFLDVPVIQGDFSAEFPATSLIPVVDFVENHPEWREAITMINASSPNDILLVPVIRGHVINIGDTTALADKFDRLKLLYSKVMSTKGWDFYREISLKWKGQIVGIRRNARESKPEYIIAEHNEEEATVSTAQLDDGIRSVVKSEKPIPAAKNRPSSAPADSTANKAPASSQKTEVTKETKETNKTR